MRRSRLVVCCLQSSVHGYIRARDRNSHRIPSGYNWAKGKAEVLDGPANVEVNQREGEVTVQEDQAGVLGPATSCIYTLLGEL